MRCFFAVFFCFSMFMIILFILSSSMRNVQGRKLPKPKGDQLRIRLKCQHFTNFMWPSVRRKKIDRVSSPCLWSSELKNGKNKLLYNTTYLENQHSTGKTMVLTGKPDCPMGGIYTWGIFNIHVCRTNTKTTYNHRVWSILLNPQMRPFRQAPAFAAQADGFGDGFRLAAGPYHGEIRDEHWCVYKYDI